MIKAGVVFALILAGISLHAQTDQKEQKRVISVIPKPTQLAVRDGQCTLTPSTAVYLSPKGRDSKWVAEYLAQFLARPTGYQLDIKSASGSRIPTGSIQLALTDGDASLGTEGYTLDATAKGIMIKAARPNGLMYGVQTLLQLLPPEVFDTVRAPATVQWSLPCVQIRDTPRFPYRGMHLDVSRHFFPKEFVKRYIDLMVMHKMNVFHWHLTDDQGWRIEIKRYPKLTEVGAWRVDKEDIPWEERGLPDADEKATYGGFYTQSDVREIVAYAAARGVSVLPEIEMPGHSSEVFAAYPEFSCRGVWIPVRPGGYWPNVDILCAGNDSVFTFMENVLTEVAALFPYQYIHIGGDEANKERWRECPKCQARMKAENLKDEEGLQSYFIRRIEKFLLSKNKRLIGWDEILQGGLAPEATVMSWRGIDGGIEAAKMGHDAIMTPISHCYFDYYQADPSTEPEAIGGYTTLKKVYSYEPIPSVLSEEEAHHIIGVQGNVWTEYMPTTRSVEYMSVPRISALAEVAWTPKGSRSWDDFRSRLETHRRRFEAMGVASSNGSYRVAVRTVFDVPSSALKAFLETEQINPEIRYTTDDSDPTGESPRYEGPFPITTETRVRAGIFVDGTRKDRPVEKVIVPHLAAGRDVRYRQPFSDRYESHQFSLVDGLRASLDFRDGSWQAFEGNDLDVIVDLQKQCDVRTVSVGFLENEPARILLPKSLEIGVSTDGEFYRLLEDLDHDVLDEEGPVSTHEYIASLRNAVPVRYIRVRAKSETPIPAGKPGEGGNAWLFVDEIIVH